MLALAATGADPTAVEEIGDALERNVDAYAAPVPGLAVGGATAKLLYGATVLDRDPRDFGGYDLRQRTLDLIAGPETPWPGWIRTRLPDGSTSGGNMFDQSLAVLELARSGGVPQPVVDFLVSQQCPAGGWLLFPDADGTPCADLPPAPVEGTVRWGLAFVCRIGGKPGPDREPCIDTPPASAYWSYWHAPNGGSWTYSQLGATFRTPPPGSFEGWSFSLDKPAGGSPPPGVPPVRPESSATSPAATSPAAGSPDDGGRPAGSGDTEGPRADGSRGARRSDAGNDRSNGSATGPAGGTAAVPGGGEETTRSFGEDPPRTGAPSPTGVPSASAPEAGVPAAPPSPVADLGLASQDLSEPAGSGAAGTVAGLALIAGLVGAAALTDLHRRRRVRP